MSRRFVLTDGGGERICVGEMAALNLLLIEYHFVRDVRRALVPIGIVAIEMDGKDGPPIDIHTTPP